MDCVICISQYNFSIFPVVGLCGHSICYKCVLQLPNTSCPICRQDDAFKLAPKNFLAHDIMKQMIVKGGIDMRDYNRYVELEKKIIDKRNQLMHLQKEENTKRMVAEMQRERNRRIQEQQMQQRRNQARPSQVSIRPVFQASLPQPVASSQMFIGVPLIVYHVHTFIPRPSPRSFVYPVYFRQ